MNPTDSNNGTLESAYNYSPSTTKEASVWIGVIRKSFEPNYTPGTEVEANPLAPDFMWCMDGDGVEKFGSGHDATLHNISPIDDRDGNPNSGLKSAGNSNSYMEIADAADFDFGAGDFTVGIWVKKLKNFAVINGSWEQCIAVGKWHSGQAHGQNEWYLDITNGGVANNPPQFAIEIGTTKYTAIGTSALPTGNWYHLVGVREGTKIKLYVNGVLEATKTVGTGAINNIAARKILIGKMESGHYVEAGFDEFVVYHRALDATEVGDLYNLGCADMDAVGGEMAEGGYRYGFQSQLKTDEISGSGNHYTAKFWEYDPRLGRRWNLDPVVKPWESGYAVMGNNPIWNIDPNGDDFENVHTKRKKEARKNRDNSANELSSAQNKLSSISEDLNANEAGFFKKAFSSEFKGYRQAKRDVNSAQNDFDYWSSQYNQEVKNEAIVNDVLQEFQNVNPEKFAEWDNFDPYGRGVIDIQVSAQGSRIQMLDDNGFPTGRTTVEGINATLGSPSHQNDYVRVRLYIVKVDDIIKIQSMTGSLFHGLGHVDGGKRRGEPYAVQYEVDNYWKKKNK